MTEPSHTRLRQLEGTKRFIPPWPSPNHNTPSSPLIPPGIAAGEAEATDRCKFPPQHPLKVLLLRVLNPIPRCRSCSETKQASEFYRYTYSKDGLYQQCKACHAKAGQSRLGKKDQAEGKVRPTFMHGLQVGCNSI